MAFLETLQGLNPGQVFPIESDTVVLGRHPECDILLDSGAVSRRHARVSREAGKYYVEDLGSRNGTYVNGQAVADRQLIGENDKLAICDLAFAFRLEPTDLDAQSRVNPEADNDATLMMFDEDRPTIGSKAISNSSTVMSKLDVSSGSSSLQLAVNTEAKLKALIKIGQDLGRAVGLSGVLSSLLDSLFTIFVQADRGFIVLKDEDSDRLIPKAVKYRRPADAETARISRTVANRVMADKEAILSADATVDERFDMADSIVDFHVRSMMCAPLINREGKALGVILIDTYDQRSHFDHDDLDVLASVSCQAAVAVENAELQETAIKERALAHELALAHEVQRGFLPAGRPRIEDYDFFDFYEPANELGGDFYDYVRLSDGRTAVVVADVSGKGIAASLLVAKLSAEFRNSLAAEPTPAEAVGLVNRQLCDPRWDDRFTTMVMCVLDPARNELTVVNAGHMPPLLRSPDGQVVAVGEAEIGLPLGVLSDEVYSNHTVPLAPGECLTLYTDGITEAMNGDNDLYGSERLIEQLSREAQGVMAVGQGILDDVKLFVGRRSQSDDMCMACFGRNAPGGGL